MVLAVEVHFTLTLSVSKLLLQIHHKNNEVGNVNVDKLAGKKIYTEPLQA